ncbi:MAG: tetratricopeptide repeat protein [Candidatus Melainabacteria bacterium]
MSVFQRSRSRTFLSRTGLLAGITGMLLLSGCDDNLVYKRSVGDLNSKAQQFIGMGDYPSAVCRLEAALDLAPNEPATLNNLAIAYKENSQYEKSLAVFEQMKKTNTDAAKAVQIEQSIAILNEAVADDLITKADELEVRLQNPPEAPAKPNPAEITALRQKAVLAYEDAIAQYNSLLGLGKGVDTKAVQEQVKALESKVDSLKNPRREAAQNGAGGV